MTTKMAKTATVATVALALVAVMLAYSAFAAPNAAQAGATSSSSTSSTYATSNSNNSSNTNSRPGYGQRGGFMQGPGGAPGQFQGGFQVGPLQGGFGNPFQQANLTVGQTITITSTKGEYYVVGDRADNGTASGSLTVTVTGKLSQGFTFSVTSGSVVVNGTTYTLSSGSGQMDPSATSLTGQGATTPAGQFILQGSARGTFAGTSANLSLDLGTGSTEYLVTLTGSVEG